MTRGKPGMKGGLCGDVAGGERSSKHLTGRGLASLQRESLYRAAGVVSCVRAGRARWPGCRGCEGPGCLLPSWPDDGAG